MVVPSARLIACRSDLLDMVAVALRLGTLAGTRRSYREVGPVYWLSPLADPVAVAAVAVSTLRRGSRWRGRSYP
jgi:dolichol-phosphate mannosyltransferase